MKNLDNIRNIFWDFDGVIMDSMPVRNKGFEIVLKDFPEEQVDELMKFHLENGGLSRYVKFRYFFEEVRNEKVSEQKIKKLASEFSKIMKELLVDESLLIADSLNFIKKNHLNYKMHVVSGSDQAELRFLCNELEIVQYFISIHGSPTPKKELVKNLLLDYQYLKENCVLIGDSINDYDAASTNQINFIGYNSIDLKDKGRSYISSFSVL
ncbi:HAD-IA family hydrolase [Gramella sp. MAR_2010_147]|uniref:HAD family hydrolase n=1 Tax=Gramella sp. MAR_2010_147 TaxID=1250205 RepID=UPI00087B7FE7|nr:HAD-IA family hydrolase [Gramella sp. MAR_2010_147]SDR69831.1 haloacid dehalogenase superfamily, subfamily IA, variant 1 with third motif having Dx(3-4)D or Dx(3-4)E [Gramella sp. MAR_2010_147]